MAAETVNAGAMEFRVLGPLEVVVDGQRIDLGGPKQRALLVALLLHANERVSQDALVDHLWGESPPPTAAKTLQAYVSRLRKALGDGATGSGRRGATLETQGTGYVLRIAAGALDTDLFQRLLEDGRRALAGGDAKRAADRLREALGLWRGPALADVAYEAFAQAEIARLDELRLTATEERVEADLALGRDAELIPELEALVERHPLRERLRGQLMLALYRADRQAQALQVYQQGRQLLAQELGLQPGEALRQLERQILDQDPALTATLRRERPAIVPAPLWRHPRRVIAAGGVLVAIAVGLAVFQLMRDTTTVDETAGAVVLDAETGAVQERVPLGTSPSAVAVGEGSVWVVDADDRTVAQIDPEARKAVRTFSTSATPTDVAVGAGGVWIGNAPSAGSFLPTSVTRLDPETGLVVATIELRPRPGGHLWSTLAGFSRQHIAVSEDAVWVINADRSVSRIDPRSNRVVAAIENVRAESIAAGDGDVWITEGDRLTEIDPSVNAVARRVRLADGLAGLAIGAGAVWVAVPLEGKILRVDTGPSLRRRSIPLETWVAGVGFGEGAVWATNEIADSVHRIDPRTGATRRVGGATSPRAVDGGEGGVWVTTARPPSADAALPASTCRNVYYDRAGSPDVLIVSSLPLQGELRQWTQPMVDAIRHVLKQRGFEAGAFTVGYQSCDSSTAQAAGDDFFRCAFTAKAFARNLRVVGAFGSFTSPCSYPQIPIVNQAPDGPLAMISPSNTVDDLTHDGTLYPSGERNYFRLATPEGYQGAAQAELARQLGHERLFLLTSSGAEYSARYLATLRRHAKDVGVRIVGTATFDPDAESFEGLARRVASSRPESVAIVGLLTPETGTMIRELRAALGRDVSLSAPDSFFLSEDLRMLAGDAAEGMYVTNYGVPNDRLPPRGRRFLDSFAAERGGDPGPDLAASYGAQGAEILLDAIARSDGRRASVVHEVRKTDVRNGVIGDIAFDPKGDVVEGPMTIFRFTRGDFVVDRVVHVRTRVASR